MNAKIWLQTFVVHFRQILEYLENEPSLLWLIYVCDDAIQSLWFLNLLISVLRLVPAEASTIYGGSNNSVCSLKVLIC